MARRTAPDGTKLHSVTVYEGFGKKLRGIVRWYDDAGKEWSVVDMNRGVVAVSKAHSGKSKASHGAVKTKKVNVTFEEKAEARRIFLRVIARLSRVDAGRILERLKRKNPREGISVSGRDSRDIERAMIGIFEEMQRESMRRAVPPTLTDIFVDALRDAHAIDFRRIDGREM